MAVSGEVESANRPEAEASPAPPEDLAKALRIEVSTVLSDRRLRFWPRSASPELRKVMASLLEALDEICRLLGRRAEICPHEPLDDVTVARLEALLSISPSGLDLDSAWQQLEGLQSMFLTLGAHDVAYVRSLLDVERGLEKRWDDDWEEPWPYYGWGRVRWRQVFPTVPVDEIPDAGSARAAATKTEDPSEPAATSPQGSPRVDDTVQKEALGLAVERLHKLFRMRVENGRKRRTRLALRNRFFVYSLLVLAPLVVALAAFTQQVGDGLSWETVTLIAVAGAVGGSVAGALKLRGLIRITQFRLLGAGVVVQPFIGAAGALFTAFILLGQVVKLPGGDSGRSWAVLAAYGFVAGFSEPFWLGVVRKIAGSPDDEPKPPARNTT